MLFYTWSVKKDNVKNILKIQYFVYYFYFVECTYLLIPILIYIYIYVNNFLNLTLVHLLINTKD